VRLACSQAEGDSLQPAGELLPAPRRQAGLGPAARAQEIGPPKVALGLVESPVAGTTSRLDVSTPIFEGPLELLLALVEREEVDIFKVSLAKVTDAYLAELASREIPDAQEMAEFLWMAARLLLLKSMRLLPGESPTDEQTELLGWEDEVRQRLEEYRAYKEIAGELLERAQQESFAFPPPARPVEAGGQEAPLDVDVLVAAFSSVLARIPPRPLVVRGRTWTVQEKLELIRDRLREGPIELVELILESEDRLEAVVTFVALLELVRRSMVRVRQKERFGPIHVEMREPAA
jgi:segregation and condensation protein A